MNDENYTPEVTVLILNSRKLIVCTVDDKLKYNKHSVKHTGNENRDDF